MFRFITLLAVISSTYAYSAGAPEGVCDDMTPKHPVDAQKSELPYKITVSKNDVTPESNVDIIISGEEFRGFLLEVRKGDKAVGEFVIDGAHKHAKTINCHGTKGSGVTHKNADAKKDLTLTWKAPKAAGKYTVYATVAKDGGVFWVRKPTEIITVS